MNRNAPEGRWGDAPACVSPEAATGARKAHKPTRFDVIRWAVRRRLDGFTLLCAALAAVGVWARALPNGVGGGFDATVYISVARNLATGQGFAFFLHSPNHIVVSLYPPLLPMTLAFVSLFGPDPLAIIGPLNAVAFGLTVFAATRWLRGQVRSRFLVAWASLALAASPPLVHVAAQGLSEPLFILFAALSLYSLDRHLATGQRARLLEAAAYAALACLTRYIGLALVVCGLGLLLSRKEMTFRLKAARSLLFACLALAPLSLWLLRNVWLTGNLTNHPFGTTPDRAWDVNAAMGILTLAQWAAGRLDPHEALLAGALQAKTQYGLALSGGILGLLALLLGLLAWGSRSGRLRWRHPGTTELLVLFIVVYALLIAAGTTAQGVEQLNHRYLAPLYAPLLCLGTRALDRVFRRGAGRLRPARRTLLRRVGMVALGLGLGPHAVLYVDEFRTHWEKGAGISNARWIESETLAYLKTHPMRGTVWSNYPFPLYLHADLPALHYRLPEGASSYRIRNRSGTYGSFPKADRIQDDTFVVWFFGSENRRDYVYDAQDLRNLPHTRLVAEWADGFLLQVHPAYVNGYSHRAQAQYAATVVHPPVVRSDFHVHLAPRRIAYVKAPCRPADAQPRFLLHVFPVAAADLPAHQQAFGFDNLDFDFEPFGIRTRGACLASRTLPAYPIAQLTVGQYDRGQATDLWKADIPRTVIAPAWVDRARALYPVVASRSPVVRAAFDVHLLENAVIYAQAPCRPADARPRFILHAFPRDAADLPAHRQAVGFDNLDFAFAQRGAHFEGKCLAQVPLPAYPIDRLRVGQFDVRTQQILWTAEFDPQTVALQAAYPDIVAGAPLAQSVFNVYRRGRDLVYVKDPCRPEDTRAKFILHVFPAARWRLPLRRWAFGFDNRGVTFAARGLRFDAKCLVRAPLPAYPIDRLRVGQFDARAQRFLWQADIPWPQAR